MAKNGRNMVIQKGTFVSNHSLGLNSAIQLRIDSYQPAQACPWKFHNAVYAIAAYLHTLALL